jgi:hypothetical protein
MPGVYEATDRSAGTGRAGLCLPYPPTTGPLVIDRKDDLRHLEMSEPWWGEVSEDKFAGCYTDGISDCSAVAIMEWNLKLKSWGQYYFHHVCGSLITEDDRSLAAAIFKASQGPRFGVVAQYYGGSAFRQADELFDLLSIPQQNRSYYKSNRSGMNFGLRFYGGSFGEFPSWL